MINAIVFKTIEEAQAEYLKLQDENKELKSKVAVLTQTETESKKTIEEMQKYNRELFLRVTTQETKKKEETEQPTKSIEEVAEEVAKAILGGE